MDADALKIRISMVIKLIEIARTEIEEIKGFALANEARRALRTATEALSDLRDQREGG